VRTPGGRKVQPRLGVETLCADARNFPWWKRTCFFFSNFHRGRGIIQSSCLMITHQGSPVNFSTHSQNLRWCPSFLSSLYQQQSRAASILNLSDNPGALHKKIRREVAVHRREREDIRRGHKGQKRKYGEVPLWGL